MKSTVVSLTVGWVDAWVLEQRQQTALAELSLAKEDIEALNSTPEVPVKLYCGGVPMFVGQLGRKQGRIAVRVDDPLDRDGQPE